MSSTIKITSEAFGVELETEGFRVGNEWFVVFGENTNDGICGKGISLPEAIEDFKVEFFKGYEDV